MSSHFPSASPTPTLMASLWPAAQLFIARNVPRHGAALAFYTVFSIAPLLVVVMAGIALLLGTAEAQVAIHDYLLRLLGPVETAAIMEITGRALARIQSAGVQKPSIRSTSTRPSQERSNTVNMPRAGIFCQNRHR